MSNKKLVVYMKIYLDKYLRVISSDLLNFQTFFNWFWLSIRIREFQIKIDQSSIGLIINLKNVHYHKILIQVLTGFW